MGIATIDVLLMHCLEWTSHVSVHANLKVPNDDDDDDDDDSTMIMVRRRSNWWYWTYCYYW